MDATKPITLGVYFPFIMALHIIPNHSIREWQYSVNVDSYKFVMNTAGEGYND